VFVIGVDIGVGLEVIMFVFMFDRLALLAELLAVVSPQAAPKAPTARMAVSAIFFMFFIYSCLLKVRNIFYCLPPCGGSAPTNKVVWNNGHYKYPLPAKSIGKMPQVPII
jgi:hypothetical protein